MPDFLTAMLGGGAKPNPNTMNPMNPKGLDFNKGASGAFAPTPANPYQSPAKFENPNDFDLAKKAKGYVAPGGYSGIEPPPLEEKTPWGDIAMAGAQGLASAMGSGQEPPQTSAPPVTGGQYFTMPKGNISDNRIGGAPKGILAQNYQL